MAVPSRYPYAGTLVFSAFAGTHQDAIKKGLDAQAARWAAVDRTGEGIKHWAMPYIPLDPKDIGLSYENLIRVSSQSGKAGTAYVIKQTLGLDLPRRMQVSFYRVVQEQCERSGKEMTTGLITDAFKKTYSLHSKPLGRLHLQSYRLFPLSPSSNESSSPISEYSDDLMTLGPRSEEQQSLVRFEGEIVVDGKVRTIQGDGSSAVYAVLDALRADLGVEVTLGEFAAQNTADAHVGSHFKATTYLEVILPDQSASKSGAGSIWGVGTSSDIATSKCRAVVSAVNGVIGDRELPRAKRVFTPRAVTSSQPSENWLRDVTLRAGRNVVHSSGQERQEYFKYETSI